MRLSAQRCRLRVTTADTLTFVTDWTEPDVHRHDEDSRGRSALLRRGTKWSSQRGWRAVWSLTAPSMAVCGSHAAAQLKFEVGGQLVMMAVGISTFGIWCHGPWNDGSS